MGYGPLTTANGASDMVESKQATKAGEKILAALASLEASMAVHTATVLEHTDALDIHDDTLSTHNARLDAIEGGLGRTIDAVQVLVLEGAQPAQDAQMPEAATPAKPRAKRGAKAAAAAERASRKSAYGMDTARFGCECGFGSYNAAPAAKHTLKDGHNAVALVA